MVKIRNNPQQVFSDASSEKKVLNPIVVYKPVNQINYPPLYELLNPNSEWNTSNNMWKKSGNENEEKISKKPYSLQDALTEALSLKAFIYGYEGRKIDWVSEETRIRKVLRLFS